MEIKSKQLIWLNSRGGRTTEDVLVDEKELMYVIMYPNQKVYVPREHNIAVKERKNRMFGVRFIYD